MTKGRSQLSWLTQTYMNKNMCLAFSLLLSLLDLKSVSKCLSMSFSKDLFGFPNTCVHGIKIKQCNRLCGLFDLVLTLTSHKRGSTRKNPALWHPGKHGRLVLPSSWSSTAKWCCTVLAQVCRVTRAPAQSWDPAVGLRKCTGVFPSPHGVYQAVLVSVVAVSYPCKI